MRSVGLISLADKIAERPFLNEGECACEKINQPVLFVIKVMGDCHIGV